MGTPQYNFKNPSVKRILQEIKEVQADTSGDFIAEALETDIFEWHFVIRGPPDTEFEGGIYHGRILLPADYPFKPPGFMMLTPNGRFETMMKICLSISSHHPEHWQPSWSVRTALTAMIAFMPTPGEGALGSLDCSKEERRKMAAKSREAAPRFGNPERQKLIEEMHMRMLAMPAKKAGASSSNGVVQGLGTPPASPAAKAQNQNQDTAGAASPAPVPHPVLIQQQQANGHANGDHPGATQCDTPRHVAEAVSAQQATTPVSPAAPMVAAPALAPVTQPDIAAAAPAPRTPRALPPAPPQDTTLLTLLAISLSMVIISILIRKLLVAAGVEVPPFMSTFIRW